MREVSVRILHFSHDLARISGIDESELFAGLPSIVLDEDGTYPDWIDWDDVVEIVERLERRLGGIEGVTQAMRDAAPTAYPEIRAFGAVFLRPIPLFKFVLTRFLPSMYRNVRVSGIEELEGDRFRWRQSIPEPYRASASFLRMSLPLAQLFPLHLDLPEARIESATITDREAEYVAAFPPSDPLVVRGARAVSGTASVLAMQLDDAFARIVETVRARAPGADGAGTSSGAGGPSPPGAPRTQRVGADWAERLSLSPRQRGVFMLLLEGRANKDIAAVLECSERNVEFHVGRILRAARVSSRAELLVKVLGARP